MSAGDPLPPGETPRLYGRRDARRYGSARWQCQDAPEKHLFDYRPETVFPKSSNEHRPSHVHVRYGGGEAVFEIEEAVQLRESQGLKVREFAKAEELATQRRGLILQRWA